MFAHGGLFKTKGVAQRFLATALDTPVTVGDRAAEGGAWGIALLAAFRANRCGGKALTNYLKTHVFVAAELSTLTHESADVAGFSDFIQRWQAALPVEKAAEFT